MTSEDFAKMPAWESLGLSVLSSAPASLTMPERLMLFALVYALRPQRCLEIGSLAGGSAVLICAALDAVGEGGLALLDPQEAAEIHPDDWGRMKHRTSLTRGRSPESLPTAAGTLGGPIDFAFIDGDHSYSAVLADVAGLLQHLAPGAVLLFHDSLNPEVARALADAPAALRNCGDLSTAPHFQDGQTWGGLRLFRFLPG